ncbi:MAG: serine/threonine protein kinase, partial [Pyrinomonadaceae bacterium]
ITIYDIGQTDAIHFIATEFVDGETLRQQLDTGIIDVRDAVDIAIQVAGALGAAHRAGIIHRDIKPENIMRRSDGYIKVLDFGLAKLNPRKMPVDAPESAITSLVNTQIGLLMGTPQYMSPEQVRGLDVDDRSDIFSLGVVLYEIIAGKNPFRASTVSDTIAAILNLEALPMSEVVPSVPKYLDGILQKMLQKNANDRHGSMEDVIFDFKTICRNEGFVAAAMFPLQDKFNNSLSDQVTQQMTIPEVTPVASVAQSTIVMEPAKAPISVMSRSRSKMILLTLLALLVVVASIWIFEALMPPVIKSEVPITGMTYQQMTDQEQSRFVKEKAENISAMLGDSPKPLSAAAVLAIK